MLAPPLTIADAELDEVVAILGDALAATHADAVRAS
jgi:4-aminobutyrate aminotransferase-like enzyme